MVFDHEQVFPKKGDKVGLLNRPDGHTSKHDPVTPGNVYEVKDIVGSNVRTTSDEPGLDASYWWGRVVVLPVPSTVSYFRFHWKDGKKEVVCIEGDSPAKAMNAAGIGAGALAALDFYEKLDWSNPV